MKGIPPDAQPRGDAKEWRTIVSWLNVVTGETGTLDETIEIPHAVLLEVLRTGAQLKIRGCIAASNARPIVDLAERTLEYQVELFPL